ncbi:hypothetical protein NPIL_359271 [Nephila pilipes]|uniref:Uncharacterized protein n=1 Tax=Nephila pilipes TaxID=299642 RepID=A0A8X6U1U9_NEPPI|nr:hypothetical protein NPIL_359271 [Nephila pilipes]
MKRSSHFKRSLRKRARKQVKKETVKFEDLIFNFGILSLKSEEEKALKIEKDDSGFGTIKQPQQQHTSPGGSSFLSSWSPTKIENWSYPSLSDEFARSQASILQYVPLVPKDTDYDASASDSTSTVSGGKLSSISIPGWDSSSKIGSTSELRSPSGRSSIIVLGSTSGCSSTTVLGSVSGSSSTATLGSPSCSSSTFVKGSAAASTSTAEFGSASRYRLASDSRTVRRRKNKVYMKIQKPIRKRSRKSIHFFKKQSS